MHLQIPRTSIRKIKVISKENKATQSKAPHKLKAMEKRFFGMVESPTFIWEQSALL